MTNLIILIIATLTILVIALAIGLYILQKKKMPHSFDTYTQTIDLRPLEKKITELQEQLPSKILQSITSSTNTYKGTLGELIGYIKLHATYDRMIPIGNIVDFICVVLPTATEPGRIDFVDIKTGKSARLNPDQKALQKLIEDKKINFIKLKVETTSSETKPE